MQQKTIPLSARDVLTLQSLRNVNHTEPVAFIITGTLMLTMGLLMTWLLRMHPQDTGLWIFTLFLLGTATFCFYHSRKKRQLRNIFEELLKANRKVTYSGRLIHMELTPRNTIRYKFEGGRSVEAYPLLVQDGASPASGYSRRMISAMGLDRSPVTLEVAPLQENTGFMLHIAYEDQPAQVSEQPILAEDRKFIMKEIILLGIIFLILLFVLYLFISFTSKFSKAALLMGWIPPAAIIAAGLIILLSRYRRSVKSATHKIVITGVVTEKITAWARVGKSSMLQTWYRVGPETFESNDASLAHPGQKLQIAFTARKDGSRGRLIAIR
ncbi:hypothetical protein ECE50_006215 [Chitinophaga sp. Mgbs1]|uniref:Uncharacterized protein n=1 Tax=Chitinophaga solisilvae TaxID=1233460 RepID=A0A3S1B1F9_9BACT|nr:hypothetical protein [Chitinophaga solisilvae]